jgi:phosphate transport system protein
MTREYYEQALRKLRDDIILMGSKVEEQLVTAMGALEKSDVNLAAQVQQMDRFVNQRRFEIEEECFMLIVTQQPAARDLRLIFAASNMIVDIERMGDQTKGIAKLVPELSKFPELQHPPELYQMGKIALAMLRQALQAYADGDTELSRAVAQRDDEVDALYSSLFNQIMQMQADATEPAAVQAAYNLLRCAREVERFADLVTNLAERSVYLVTGTMSDFSSYPN